ncbi:MAG TPA: hypothetical protein VK139_04635 [Microbacteriaceae bacterium]|nr:hypothetical protein [Microbacteriaceae bacterium]
MRKRLANLFEARPIAWMWLIHGTGFVMLCLVIGIPVVGQLACLSALVIAPIVSVKAVRKNRVVNPKPDKPREPRKVRTAGPRIVASNSRNRVNAVQVGFRELEWGTPSETSSRPQLYSYKWNLSTRPEVGDWVIVRNQYGTKYAYIHELGAGPEAAGYELKPVHGHIPAAQYEAMVLSWLAVAAGKAGVGDSSNAQTPKGFPSVPPLKGRADAEKADEYGDRWWTLYRTAKQVGRPKDEIEAFRVIAKRWYEIRDSKL